MGFKCGIVGLPNVGKSTLLDTLTKAGIKAANFPFCTIEPNTDVVPMPDPRLDQLAEIVKPQRTLPTTMELVDIAGLIKGASKGEGLGNQFLTNIRETEAIGHVVRCFENNNIIHVSDKVNPADDIEVISTELTLADLDACECAIHRVQKRTKSGNKDARAELTVLEKCLPQLENTGMLRALDLSAEEKAAVRYLSFLTLEPTMYIANVSEGGSGNNPYLDQVCEVTTKEGSVIVPVCAAIEADTAELDNGEHDESMQEPGLGKPGLSHMIRTGYKLLNLQTYFTTGMKEARAWTIPVGTTAPQTTNEVHIDFGKGFICAQTISFEDFIIYKDKQGMKGAGRMRVEDKDYITKDDDVMNFLFSV